MVHDAYNFPDLVSLKPKPILIFIFSLGVLTIFSCREKVAETEMINDEWLKDSIEMAVSIEEKIDITGAEYVELTADITAGDYYHWINFWVDSINRRTPHFIDEYILVHANSWIIDSLRNTDYYYLKEKGIKSLDPKLERIAEKGRKLLIPDSLKAAKISFDLDHTYLDLNVPEFILRVYQHNKIIRSFPVRVGKNERRFLAMAGREVDLRTRPGIGTIIRVNRQAAFINPRDNKRYQTTKRDDGVVTQLPNIPWIEPEINGVRHGHLIHPTTNIETLGKPSSNGCIGMREADAWTVYFYARLGTPIQIRYDLEILDEKGEKIRLSNIYPGFEKLSKPHFSDTENINKIALPEGINVCYCGKVE
jgi:hypothetical protein